MRAGSIAMIGPPLDLAHRRPASDLIDGAAAADAQPCVSVEQADVDARRFHRRCRLIVPCGYVGNAAEQGNQEPVSGF